MKKIFVKKPSRIIFTQEGYDSLLREQQSLLHERPSAVENLRKAREMGDLSENGYYKAARARLSFIDARLRGSNRLIRLAKIVSPSDKTRVEIGSIVSITDGTTISKYSIVGGYESNPAKGTISHLSPLGKALLNGRVGDSVSVISPKGKKSYSILTIE